MLFFGTDKRYNQFSEYLKEKLKYKIYKVTLDAGFSCPNRDGTISHGGCIFCDDGGSFSKSHDTAVPLKQQLYGGIETLKRRFKAQKFLSYLQAYSNTYKQVDELKNIYDKALDHPDVLGLCIGTRPDCVDGKKLDLIGTYTQTHHIWIEYGLQSIHNKTLEYINRGHDYACFEKAFFETKKRGINVCAHVIMGLPNETYDDMMATAKKLAELKIDGVKIHMLCVLQNSELYRRHQITPVKFMSEMEYVNIVCDFLEFLPPTTTIHRLAGNGLMVEMYEPRWLQKKFEVLNKIDREFIRRDSFQGAKYTQ